MGMYETTQTKYTENRRKGPGGDFEEIHYLQVGCGTRRKTKVVLLRQGKEGFKRVGSVSHVERC